MNDTLKIEEVTNESMSDKVKMEESIEAELKEENKLIKKIDSETLSLNGDAYKIVENYREGLDLEMLEARYSDFLEKYDYIVGDISYEKLRLRGFYYATNKKVPIDMRITSLKDYLTEYCNFGCAYFVLERMEPKKKQKSPSKRKNKPNSKSNASKKSNVTSKQTNQRKSDQVKKQENKPKPKKREQTKKEQTKKTFTKKDRQNNNTTVSEKNHAESNKVKTIKNQKGETKFKIRQKNNKDR